MPRHKKLSPIEIANIRVSYPFLIRHVTLPGYLVAAILGRQKPPRIRARDLKKLAAALMSGPAVVALRGKGLSIKPKRGPGRPAARRTVAPKHHAPKPGADKRGRAMSAKRRAAQKLQGRYMGILNKLPKVHRAAVRKDRASNGYSSAFTLAAKLTASTKPAIAATTTS